MYRAVNRMQQRKRGVGAVERIMPYRNPSHAEIESERRLVRDQLSAVEVAEFFLSVAVGIGRIGKDRKTVRIVRIRYPMRRAVDRF